MDEWRTWVILMGGEYSPFSKTEAGYSPERAYFRNLDGSELGISFWYNTKRIAVRFWIHHRDAQGNSSNHRDLKSYENIIKYIQEWRETDEG